jgi:GNAT superfamily N-acetyltransferase
VAEAGWRAPGCIETVGAESDHGEMSITFRRGTDAEARAAADLWLRARKAAVGAIPLPVHDDDVRAWFASHVVSEMDLWLGVDAAGTLVGILVLNGPWVDQLYVEPTMTGRGIGGALVRLAKRERPDALRLWTFASNTGAQVLRAAWVRRDASHRRARQRGGRTPHPLRVGRRPDRALTRLRLGRQAAAPTLASSLVLCATCASGEGLQVARAALPPTKPSIRARSRAGRGSSRARRQVARRCSRSSSSHHACVRACAATAAHSHRAAGRGGGRSGAEQPVALGRPG